ncbi:hypothetical protein [Bifidobacterium sp. SO1]|uniref:hypothetical protein n=1 Tax=Bifidobacterium sp. SO1 TaxID=2809029 RepID=UPI001BDBBC07|nr:hypothetical protein [Bifidobacterium sp. SO1]MBT1161699.1 hypothetical protein [Bifidobacterium sp. SO1]
MVKTSWETMLKALDADEEPSGEQVDLADNIIAAESAGRPLTAETFGLYAQGLRRRLDRMIEHAARRHMAGPEADDRRIIRFWTGWETVESRLRPIIRDVDRTSCYEADKARFLMRRRLRELEGESCADFDRTGGAYWIPDHGEWEDWRPIVDHCLTGRWDTETAVGILRLIMDGMEADA